MARKNQTPPKSYEEAEKELEQILGAIERGEIPLEESLTRYERGTFLLGWCRQVLDSAEKQIELISRGENGAPKLEKLEAEPES